LDPEYWKLTKEQMREMRRNEFHQSRDKMGIIAIHVHVLKTYWVSGGLAQLLNAGWR
jgi:hypothetical protein